MSLSASLNNFLLCLLVRKTIDSYINGAICYKNNIPLGIIRLQFVEMICELYSIF